MSDFSTNMTISIGFSCLIIIIGFGFGSLQEPVEKEYRPNSFLLWFNQTLEPFAKDIQSNPMNIFNYPIVLAMLGFVLFPPFVVYGGLYYCAWLPLKIHKKIKGSQKLSEVIGE